MKIKSNLEDNLALLHVIWPNIVISNFGMLDQLRGPIYHTCEEYS